MCCGITKCYLTVYPATGLDNRSTSHFVTCTVSQLCVDCAEHCAVGATSAVQHRDLQTPAINPHNDKFVFTHTSLENICRSSPCHCFHFRRYQSKNWISSTKYRIVCLCQPIISGTLMICWRKCGIISALLGKNKS